MLSNAHCLTVDKAGCWRSTISSFSRRTAPGSWTEPLHQEIPLDLQLANLLVELSDEGRTLLLLLGVVTTKDAGGTLQQSLLPCTDLALMDLIPIGYLCGGLFFSQCFQCHLGFGR